MGVMILKIYYLNLLLVLKRSQCDLVSDSNLFYAALLTFDSIYIFKQ